MPSPLEKEFRYFLSHQEELVKQYRGRFVVIKDEKVIGDFETELEAVVETSKTHAKGTFLVQRALPGNEEYTQTFHSRVAFA